MIQMILVDKVNEETGEAYEKWAWPEEGKTYSDFRHMESLLMKLASYVEEFYPIIFRHWLEKGQDDTDFADLIIQLFPDRGLENDRQ